jgi:hypothetical protein
MQNLTNTIRPINFLSGYRQAHADRMGERQQQFNNQLLQEKMDLTRQQFQVGQEEAERERQSAVLMDQAYGAAWADTPEKYAQFLRVQEMEGNPVDPIYQDFATRELLITKNKDALKMIRPEKTTKQKDFEYGAERPEFRQYEMGLRRASAPKTELKIGLGDKKWQEAQASSIDKGITYYRERGQAALKARPVIERLSTLIQNIDSGPWEETKFNMAKAFNSVGLNIDDISNVEEFKSQSGELVREFLNAATGPQTDSDRFFLQTITPDFGKTKEGNKRIIQFARSRNLIDSYIAGKARSLYKLPTLDEASSQFVNLENYADRISVATIAPDGTPVTFVEYWETAKRKGMSKDDAIQSWIEETQ